MKGAKDWNDKHFLTKEQFDEAKKIANEYGVVIGDYDKLTDVAIYHENGLPTAMGLRLLNIAPMINYHKEPHELPRFLYEFYKANGINVIPGEAA